MRLYTINTGFFKLDGGAMFGVVPKSIWNKLNPADENNLCSWAMRCLLVEEGSRLLLIDNGIGDKQDAKFFSHYHLHGEDTLDRSLAAHGFHRNDITDVLLTHLHFDHCGGSIIRSGDRLIPAFPNATYWSNHRHWEWATRPNDREKASFLRENILPIEESGRLAFLDAPASAFLAQQEEVLRPFPFPDFTGLSLFFAGGHTDAMMLPVIDYKGRRIIFLADLMPSVAHLPLPYVMGYDMFPLTTLNEKKRLLEQASANDWVLFFEHDPLVECCTVGETDKGIRKKETFSLSAW
jgi:glyoxylase-like metal-dependent hydrolase (beta-lactamase superfamily II)